MSSKAHISGLKSIATILKSNGSDGQLLVSFTGIDIEELELQKPVFIIFDGMPVPFFVSDLIPKGNGRALLRLTDIESNADALEVSGRSLYVEASEERQEDGLEGFIGWKVVLPDGRSFEVTDIEDIPGNPCLALGPSGTLVPLHEDFIVSMDDNTRTLTLNLPDGLVN